MQNKITLNTCLYELFRCAEPCQKFFFLILRHSTFTRSSMITSTLGAQPLAACANQCSELVVEESSNHHYIY
ncbi:hypothetical protein WN51_13198 [Melipona quadrifasciata]|uniref:Uncharacterized protein n=1 Tax=Melipona quadrifasciata TaxID=166423 RepID=A0A0N0U5I4_9HYME|nr:hypothetical protein WN51_13198 [Melipona quadrifasciata]